MAKVTDSMAVCIVRGLTLGMMIKASVVKMLVCWFSGSGSRSVGLAPIGNVGPVPGALGVDRWGLVLLRVSSVGRWSWVLVVGMGHWL